MPLCQKCIVYQISVTKNVLLYHFIVSLQYYAMFNNVIFTVNQAVIVFLYLQKLMIHRFLVGRSTLCQVSKVKQVLK